MTGRIIGTRVLRAFACLAILVVLMVFWAAGESRAQTSWRDVRVGIFVTSLSGINPSDGSFRIGGYLWFIDPAGRFDPDRDFEFLARSATHEVFSQRSLPNGATYTAISFDAVVDQAFDVRDYPFDEQKLALNLESARRISTLAFVPDREASRVADFVRAPGWDVEDLELSTALETYDTDFGYRGDSPVFARLTATITMQRDLSPFLLEKFTGFFVAFVITALVIFVPIEELGTRVGMTTGSVFAAVFNLYRIDDGIGHHADFGVVDQVSLLTFSAILLILVLSLLTHNMNVTRGPGFARLVNRRAGATIVVVHLLLGVIGFAVAMT